MANYIGTTRTNWFHVASPAAATRLKNLLDKTEIDSGDAIELWHDDKSDTYAFGTFGAINGLFDEGTDECDLDAFWDELAVIVAKDDAIVVTEVGHETLRYLVARSIVIADGRAHEVTLDATAIGYVRKALGDKGDAWAAAAKFDY